MTMKTLRSFVGCKGRLKNICAHFLGAETFSPHFSAADLAGFLRSSCLIFTQPDPESVRGFGLSLATDLQPTSRSKTAIPRGMSKWVELARQGRSGTPHGG